MAKTATHSLSLIMGNTLQTQTLSHEQLSQNPADEEFTCELSQNPADEEFTCEICIEPTLKHTNKFINANRCSHAFCTDCMIKYIAVKLEESDGIGDIICPALNCHHALDPLACASIVGDDLFVRWCDAMCKSAIMGFDKCYCPYRNCNVLIVNECGGNLKKSKCPECKRWFCFECKMVWHAGFDCGEESGDENDVAFGRLVEQRKWIRCPGCRHFVELMEGCQIVKCRCRIRFCYKCGNGVHYCENHSRFISEWCFRAFVLLFYLLIALLFWYSPSIERAVEQVNFV